MAWLANVVVQLLKWIPPLVVHEIIVAFKKWNDTRKEKKHKQAVTDLKEAETEEEQKDALRDLVDNP